MHGFSVTSFVTAAMRLTIPYCIVWTTAAVAQATLPSGSDIKRVLVKVADRAVADVDGKIEEFSKDNLGYGKNLDDWTWSVAYDGLHASAKALGDSAYRHICYRVGERLSWKTGRHNLRPAHGERDANGMVIIHSHLDCYLHYRQPKMYLPSKTVFDRIIADPNTDPLEPNNRSRWSICDYLYMGPPAFIRMSTCLGDSKYLDYMDSEWWATSDLLYDTEQHLWYRDKSKMDVFWARGVGWVVGGLVQVLEHLPVNHKNRARYETQLKEMAAALKKIQMSNGFWASDLLQPDNKKESSGTGFFCYGLAWGINNGLLDRTDYLPVVASAWNGLVTCVHDDGVVGYVQAIGSGPGSAHYGSTGAYGTGAVMLAGAEVYKLATGATTGNRLGMAPVRAAITREHGARLAPVGAIGRVGHSGVSGVDGFSILGRTAGTPPSSGLVVRASD